ncbi:hypothetical protein G7046_g7548 [Stylonectria norvegica]|nr:hypothetical protein G7046_g7548 [Stylonectria norvegica]
MTMSCNDAPRPSPSPLPGDSPNAISLRARGSPAPPQRYFDDENHANDDPPPQYTDHDHEYGLGPDDPAEPLFAAHDHLLQPFSQNGDGTIVYYLDPRLDSDPAFLERHIKDLATEPPRPKRVRWWTLTSAST